MDIDKIIISGLYKNLNKKFPAEKIIIKKVQVELRKGHVYKILLKKNSKTKIYYAKYYSNFEKAKKIAELNKYQFDSKKYQMTRPVFLFDDFKTIVFNNIGGIRFSRIIPYIISPTYYANKGQANRIIKKIAKCLVYIHRATNPGIKNSIDIDYTLSILKKIESLNQIEKSKVTFMLKNNHHTIGELPLLFSHNDFVSKNIIISKDLIGLIDVDSFSFDNRIFDFHSFFTNLEFKAIIPIYSKKIINKIRSEFILEYKKFYPISLTE